MNCETARERLDVTRPNGSDRNDPDLQRGEFVLVLAGKPARESGDIPEDTLRLLKILCEEMPVKQAASVLARFSGLKKNQLYQAALRLDRD